MKTKSNLKKLSLVLTMMVGATTAIAQEKPVNPLVEKLGGNKLKREQAIEENKKASKTRGLFTPRGQSGTSSTPKVEVPEAVKGKERKVIFTPRGLGSATSRGVASATSVTDTPINGVKIASTKAPAYNPNQGSKGDLAAKPGEKAYEMTYTVDPTSQLKGEIKFEKGSTEIVDTDSLRFLFQLGDAIGQLEDMKFVIEGHASADGSAEANQNLSQDRANKIFDVLTSGKHGIAGDRLLPVGFGESEARFPDTASDRVLAEDRRVLIYQLVD